MRGIRKENVFYLVIDARQYNVEETPFQIYLIVSVSPYYIHQCCTKDSSMIYGGLCITDLFYVNSQLHYVWIQYQVAHPKQRCYTMPFNMACCLPKKELQNHGSSIKWPSLSIIDPLQSPPKILGATLLYILEKI